MWPTVLLRGLQCSQQTVSRKEGRKARLQVLESTVQSSRAAFRGYCIWLPWFFQSIVFFLFVFFYVSEMPYIYIGKLNNNQKKSQATEPLFLK